MPPATPAAQATTRTPNRSSRLRTPWVAPLMANTKVAPRSSASSSMAGRLHRLHRRPEMAECSEGEDMASGTYRDWRVFRFIIGRKRLLASTVAGLILLALLPNDFRWATRFILAWDLTALLYITMIMWMIRCSTVEDCQDHAALNDEGDWVILLLVVGAVAASFVCIAVELPVLQSPKHSLVLG